MGGIQIFPSDFSVAALDVHSGIYPASHFPPPDLHCGNKQQKIVDCNLKIFYVSLNPLDDQSKNL